MVEVYLNGLKINPCIYGRVMNHVEKPEQKVLVIPVDSYSRTSGYYAGYSHLNKGKKSERDERVYYKIPENLT